MTFPVDVLRRAARGLLLLGSLALGLAVAAPPEAIHVATFDSGFGGYLTAKSIEGAAGPLLRDYDARITIHHFGDTKNLPYGEKSPAQILALGSAGVLKAFGQGAEMVFVACNTASTQFEGIRRAVDQAYPGRHLPLVSVIDASTAEARRQLDLALAHRQTATLAILATPATVRSMAYPRQLALSYGAPITEEPVQKHTQPRWFGTGGATLDNLTQKSVIGLPGGHRIDVFQLAPANWVELIEHGASPEVKRETIRRDLGELSPLLGPNLDVVGYFCTHYPILDATIREELGAQCPAAREAGYISQGALMAKIFQGMAEKRLQGHRRRTPVSAARLRKLKEAARPDITITGRNGATTRELAHTMFPADPVPVVTEED